MTTLDSLRRARCTPLRGSEHRLSAELVQSLLAILGNGWVLSADATGIEKTFRFANYYHTIAFVNALAFVAHGDDHHPDLGVHYDRCLVRYSTHDVGGLSRNDFVSAAKADALVG